VTTEPLRPSATISASRPKAPHKLVPVEAPTRRPGTALAWRAAAIDAASGTDTMRSTTSGRKDGSTRGLPIPSIRDDAEITM
jgi:hypothetical protein